MIPPDAWVSTLKSSNCEGRFPKTDAPRWIPVKYKREARRPPEGVCSAEAFQAASNWIPSSDNALRFTSSENSASNPAVLIHPVCVFPFWSSRPWRLSTKLEGGFRKNLPLDLSKRQETQRGPRWTFTKAMVLPSVLGLVTSILSFNVFIVFPFDSGLSGPPKRARRNETPRRRPAFSRDEGGGENWGEPHAGEPIFSRPRNPGGVQAVPPEGTGKRECPFLRAEPLKDESEGMNG